MKGLLRSAVRLLAGTALTVAASLSPAQTPSQLEYERQQREYWRQQEQQRQEQQRQQQIMQDNARRQQEESSRINAPSGQSQGGAAPNSPQGRSADPTGAQAHSAARAMWEKRPALAADRNPLLGKWMRPPSTRPNPSDPFGAITAMAKGGLCEVLFGSGGVFEFRPDRLMGMDERTPPQELDRVEYRGDARHVVVLPRTTLKLIEFDVEGPDRINWASQKCVLVRAGAASGVAATRAPAAASTAAAAAPSAASAAGGTLAVSVGALSADKSSSAGRNFLVLKQDPQSALIQGGIKSTPYASVLQNWMRACIAKTPDCERGARALQPYVLGRVTTDANGHAQPATLPVGRYWILGDTKVGDKRIMWHELVDLKGDRSVTLDLHNALPVE
ncbi:MAG TPA: hypothetical protein PLE54_06605 [Burkholderiaceae bacterium]|nr:hypothetical protein [Burkholderiaceae bacterium]